MKRIKILTATITIFFLVLVNVVLATPHRMLIGYKVGRIDIEVYFDDGTPSRYIDVKVYDPEGYFYLEGVTDGGGKFSFMPDSQGNWKVVAEDAMGHRAEAIIDFKGKKVCGEFPLYAKVISGLGYLVGVAGLASGYLGWRAKRKRE